MARSASPILLAALLAFVFVHISPTSAQGSPCSSKSQTFVTYEQVLVGNTSATTSRVITNSPVGELDVQAEPMRTAISPTSTRVGTTYGTTSELVGGAGSDTIFLVYDYHIDGELVVNGGKKVYFKGTLVSVGGVSLTAPVATTAILGGTGDFLYARGVIATSLVASDSTVKVTFKKEFTFWCEGPRGD